MKSSSHPRSHSLSRIHFRISFLFRILAVISVDPSPSLFFFGVIYHFGVSLCVCNLLASLLSFLSSALPPLFLFFFISKIQFSLPLTSSRNSLYLPRYLLHSDLFLPLFPPFSLSISHLLIRSFRLFRFSAQSLPLISLSISDPLLLSPIFFLLLSLHVPSSSRLSCYSLPYVFSLLSLSHDLSLPHVVPLFLTVPNPVIFNSAFLLLSLHLSIFLPF